VYSRELGGGGAFARCARSSGPCCHLGTDVELPAIRWEDVDDAPPVSLLRDEIGLGELRELPRNGRSSLVETVVQFGRRERIDQDRRARMLH
jgi:hypothetical protein